jgi:ABC-type cobalamin/Fe3+-siderophores transport system ATPase subunit
MIAGPNGSGKTTLTRYLTQEHRLSPGVYINADDIERTLRTESGLHFTSYSLSVTEAETRAFFQQHPLNKESLENHFLIQNDGLKMAKKAYGYFAGGHSICCWMLSKHRTGLTCLITQDNCMS